MRVGFAALPLLFIFREQNRSSRLAFSVSIPIPARFSFLLLFHRAADVAFFQPHANDRADDVGAADCVPGEMKSFPGCFLSAAADCR
jgi:hypothetical protein